jgi:hypothetical protein
LLEGDNPPVPLFRIKMTILHFKIKGSQTDSLKKSIPDVLKVPVVPILGNPQSFCPKIEPNFQEKQEKK